jgi:hypothetical protein
MHALTPNESLQSTATNRFNFVMRVMTARSATFARESPRPNRSMQPTAPLFVVAFLGNLPAAGTVISATPSGSAAKFGRQVLFARYKITIPYELYIAHGKHSL